MEDLKTGLYYLLMTQGVQAAIARQSLTTRVERGKCDKEALIELLSTQVASAVKEVLEDQWDAVQKENRQHANDSAFLIDTINKVFQSPAFSQAVKNALPVEPSVLLEVKDYAIAKPKPRPTSDIYEPAIIIPDNYTPQLGSQLLEELQGCDRADWLVSFIKLSAVNRFYSELQKFCAIPAPDGGPRLRIATTTYTGASDFKALEKLLQLPNTEIRVAYDNHDTRHHAKAYLFYRETGFSTAYIGSANLSSPAMSVGLEWTVKLTESTMPHLWDRARYAFLQSWDDDKRFERLTKADLPRLKDALEAAKSAKSSPLSGELPYFTLEPHHYQEIALDAIARERANGKHRHLIVAATGTGKTMVAAFDYRTLCRTTQNLPTLLFIVHRRDILAQALHTYRHVIRDTSFGDIVLGETINDTRHLFCTPQTWKNRVRDQFEKDYFSTIVVDECHHIQAASYVDILNYYAEAIESGKTDLLGLTATPEREDGKDIRDFFDGKITNEISLCDAINNNYLVPFDYFALEDTTSDFSAVRWEHRGEAENAVQKILSGNRALAENVYNELLDHVNDPKQIRAIGFCAGLQHARLMADKFNLQGLPAEVLSGEDDQTRRKDIVSRFTQLEADRRINVIFVADLFNEGVDIPCIDTLLLLRPTDSATIFTQQLGRGLRKHEGKERLLVLDFVAPQNERFNGAKRFNVLTTQHATAAGIREQVEHGMPFLPQGCSVKLEQGAQEVILKNLNAYIAHLRGQRFINEVKTFIKNAGRAVPTNELLNAFNLDTPKDLYKNSIAPNYTAMVTLGESVDDRAIDDPSDFLLRVMENDDITALRQWSEMLQPPHYTSATTEQEIGRRFDLISAYNRTAKITDTENFWKEIYDKPGLRNDLLELIDWMRQNILPRRPVQGFTPYHGLHLHCRYSRKQICRAMGGNGYLPQQGLLDSLHEDHFTALFVTRKKLESQFSAHTMYNDYAISPSRFHWESQSRITQTMTQCRDFVSGKKIPLLFLQESKKTAEGAPRSFIFLGPMTYRAHEGNKPVKFIWDLNFEMPPDVFEWAQ